MSRPRRLIVEIHRRSLWQVLGLYLAGGWVGYEIIQSLTEGLGLAVWLPALAVVLFIIFLPVVLATAFVQEGVGSQIPKRRLWLVLGIYLLSAWLGYQVIAALSTNLDFPGWFPGLAGVLFIVFIPFVFWSVFVREEWPSGKGFPRTARESAQKARMVPLTDTDGGVARQYLTWRNVMLGGVLLFAVWGIVAASWVFVGFPGFVIRAEAADFFNAQDRVVVAEFENLTDQAALALAVREAIITDLDQSEYIRVVDRKQLSEVLALMRLESDIHIDDDLALEVARRAGHPAVVAGGVSPLGAGYQLTVRIIEASTGAVAVRLRETAENDATVLGAVERLARLVRRHLGESLVSLRRAQPLPSVTTGSLEALQLFARGRDTALAGDQLAAIPLVNEAVALDSGFAAAHRALGIWHSQLGDPVTAQIHIDRAHRHGQRLVPRERYMTAALFHAFRGRVDSAAHYYGRAAERYPDLTAAINNLGDAYERMGRYEEARNLYRRAFEQDESAVNLFNLASAERTLGHHVAADSAVERLQQAFPNTWITWSAQTMNPYYAGDYARVQEIARNMADSPWPFPRAYGRWLLASIAGMEGRLQAALALADSAIDFAREYGSRPFPYEVLRVAVYTALAAGELEGSRALLAKVGLPEALGSAPISDFWVLGYLANGHAVLGEVVEARRLLARMDSLAEAHDLQPPGIGDQAHAVIALQENRPEESLERLRRARTMEYGLVHHPSRLFLGDTYAALGQLELAAANYDSLASTYRLDFRDQGTYGPLRPLAHERAGNAYIALGDTAAALKHLLAFVDLWNDADAELQPRVEAARQKIAALSTDR